jgi:hypothetical protein
LLTATKQKHRSIPRTKSGHPLPRNVDYRSVTGRRFRDLYENFAQQFGVGALSEIELGLVRQAAMLELEAETMQQRRLRGEMIDADTLIRLSGAARRILSSIGTKSSDKRQAAGPDPLAAHIAANYANRSDSSPNVDDAEEIEAVAE